MYESARADVLFGDVFEAPYLFDVHLQADAVRLTSAEFPPKAPLAGAFHAEPSEGLPLSGDLVRAHGRSGRERPGREHRHTLALPGRAILLSDDCHISTAYGDRPGRDRGGARGRLLFASVVPADDETVEKVRAGSAFGRFALPAEGPMAGGAVAELKRTFQVHAGAVDPADRIASLDEGARLALDKRWNAFICRRGPEASRQNASKLGQLVAGGPTLDPVQQEAVAALWQTLDLAWDLEGRTMRAAPDALEVGGPAGPVVQNVVADLRGLAALASDAADRLSGL